MAASSPDEPMMRSASRTGLVVSVPTLKSLQGANNNYHVLRLERSAEEMSQAGSDIGQEIRKINAAEKARSRESSMHRENSIQRSDLGDAVHRGMPALETTMSRACSYADSLGAMRFGGYSPGGFVTSPAASVRSGSWSHASMHRGASGSKSSRLAQIVEPMQEGRPLDSPLTLSASGYSPQHPSTHASQSSFGQRYDGSAGQKEEQLHLGSGHGVSLPEGPITPPDRPRSADTFQEAQIAFRDFDGVHFSPLTEDFPDLDDEGNEVRRVSVRTSPGNLSMDAASLLRTPRARPISYAAPPPDEGMVYYPAPVPRMLNLPKRLSQLPSASVQAKRRSQVLGQLAPEVRQSAPWIPELVFSDAGSHRSISGSQSGQSHPSQGHPAQAYPTTTQAPASHPRSALNERMSIANFQNLPPQLRASVFFDHQSVSQDVEVKSQSAVATLDSILAASATAPVSAFTDHPFAGDVRKTTYRPEKLATRRTTATLIHQATNAEPEGKVEKRRSSLSGLLKRTSSADELAGLLDERASRTSTLLDFNRGGKKLQKRKSQLSLADELDRQNDQRPRSRGSELSLGNGLVARAQNASPHEVERERLASQSRPGTAMSHKPNEAEPIRQDFEDAEAQEEVEEDETEPTFAQPTTLLAELQVRKAQQKSRNRTAATAFPQGMHSTLLELDAVAEIDKRKRKNHRIALAWEDPGLKGQDAERDDEDEDVPLGVLYPSRDGLVSRKMGDERDWNRPLGLMEKRQLEDSEPLSSRRNRMKGLPPGYGRVPSSVEHAGVARNTSELHLASQPDTPPEAEGPGEHQGETLKDRLQRLKTKSALDQAIGDVTTKDGRPFSTFTNDVLSQFGGLDVKDKDAAVGAKEDEPAGDEEDETLGQRRARLTREREANGGTRDISGGSNRPALSTKISITNLLSANPVGTKQVSRQHQPAQGTLLYASAQAQAQAKQQLVNTNMRASSYGFDRPLVEPRPNTDQQPLMNTGLLGKQASGMALTGGFAGGMWNNGTGIAQPLQTSASTPMLGMQAGNNYFVPATLPLGYAQPGMTYQQPQIVNPLAYSALTDAAPMATPGFPMMSGTYAYGAQHMGMGGMPCGANIGMAMDMVPEEPMTAQQRSAIDHWRMSVMQ